eukprot:Nk52_evm22s2531 gene=Nk52_evmTU22s2531
MANEVEEGTASGPPALVSAEGDGEEKGAEVEAPEQEEQDGESEEIIDLEHEEENCSSKQDLSKVIQMQWAYGINQNLIGGIHNLSKPSEKKDEIFYAVGNTGVIYNASSKSQRLLQGHCNAITATCTSGNRRWLATADEGKESALIVWDGRKGNPIRTYFSPHENGVVSMDMSSDAMLLLTMGNDSAGRQVVSLWDWTNEAFDIPVATLPIKTPIIGMQKLIKFNTVNKGEFLTVGDRGVGFYRVVTKETSSGIGYNLQGYYPSVHAQDERSSSLEPFSNGTFVGDTSAAVISNRHGELAIFDYIHKKESGEGDGLSDKEVPVLERELVKSMKVNKLAIDFLDCTASYIVTGGADGTVKFYDFNYRLVNWFEDFKFGGITNVSFVYEEEPTEGSAESATKEVFKVPDFIVGTRQCAIIKVESEKCIDLVMEQRKTRLLLRGQERDIRGLDTHPTRPYFVVTGMSGFVQVWNYESHTTMVTRQFDKHHQAFCIKYDSSGDTIAIGFTNGEVKILDSLSLRDYSESTNYKVSSSPVLKIAFSNDGAYFAVATASFSVGLFRVHEPNTPNPWSFVGSYIAHYKTITSLDFLEDQETGKLRLFSLGLDRSLIEYDLENSSLLDGIKLLSATEIEQVASPTACAWYPPICKEHFIMTANSEYKIKLYSTASKMCRKTSLGPTYAGPVNKLIVLPNVGTNGLQHYVAYGTGDRVVGLLNLPLDGNPYNNMALVAHPGEISNMTATNDGKYLMTAGGADGSVFFWTINTKALDALSSLGGTKLEPYLGLIEGGVDGDFFKELEDYFYYSQVMNDNEHKTKPRKVSDKVKIENVPTIFRALGFYPSEQGVEDIVNEVKFRDYVETGQYVSEIGIEDLVKLYINHRPVYGVSKESLQIAFQHISEDASGKVDRARLLSLLQKAGEHLTEEELSEYLGALIGDDELSALLPETLDAEGFGTGVLDFSL